MSFHPLPTQRAFAYRFIQCHIEQATATGIFGVPAIAVGQGHFGSNDVTVMFEDWLQHPWRFDTETYRQLQHLLIRGAYRC